jgi:hypothetical protein
VIGRAVIARFASSILALICPIVRIWLVVFAVFVVVTGVLPTTIGAGVGVAAKTGFGVGTGVGGKVLVTITLFEGVGVTPTIRARVCVVLDWTVCGNILVDKTSRNENTDKYFIRGILWGE